MCLLPRCLMQNNYLKVIYSSCVFHISLLDINDLTIAICVLFQSVSGTALASLVKGLPEALQRQYEYEDPIVRSGKHLMHSPFFKVGQRRYFVGKGIIKTCNRTIKIPYSVVICIVRVILSSFGINTVIWKTQVYFEYCLHRLFFSFKILTLNNHNGLERKENNSGFPSSSSTFHNAVVQTTQLTF